MIDANLKLISEKGHDLCVLCERETEYLTITPIFKRHNYVEGAGQLCDKCYVETFGTETKIGEEQ